MATHTLLKDKLFKSSTKTNIKKLYTFSNNTKKFTDKIGIEYKDINNNDITNAMIKTNSSDINYTNKCNFVHITFKPDFYTDYDSNNTSMANDINLYNLMMDDNNYNQLVNNQLLLSLKIPKVNNLFNPIPSEYYFNDNFIGKKSYLDKLINTFMDEDKHILCLRFQETDNDKLYDYFKNLLDAANPSVNIKRNNYKLLYYHDDKHELQFVILLNISVYHLVGFNYKTNSSINLYSFSILVNYIYNPFKTIAVHNFIIKNNMSKLKHKDDMGNHKLYFINEYGLDILDTNFFNDKLLNNTANLRINNTTTELYSGFINDYIDTHYHRYIKKFNFGNTNLSKLKSLSISRTLKINSNNFKFNKQKLLDGIPAIKNITFTGKHNTNTIVPAPTIPTFIGPTPPLTNSKHHHGLVRGIGRNYKLETVDDTKKLINDVFYIKYGDTNTIFIDTLTDIKKYNYIYNFYNELPNIIEDLLICLENPHYNHIFKFLHDKNPIKKINDILFNENFIIVHMLLYNYLYPQSIELDILDDINSNFHNKLLTEDKKQPDDDLKFTKFISDYDVNIKSHITNKIQTLKKSPAGVSIPQTVNIISNYKNEYLNYFKSFVELLYLHNQYNIYKYNLETYIDKIIENNDLFKDAINDLDGKPITFFNKNVPQLTPTDNIYATIY
jgi:hypothetical protein